MTTALRLTGASGEYVSTPDTTSLRLTSDLCLVAHVALDDWTPTAPNYVVDKAQTYRLYVNTTGGLAYYFYYASNRGPYDSTVAPTVSNGEALWIAVTHDKAALTCKFWTSSDGSSWSQLGATITGLYPLMSDTGDELAVGAYASGTFPLTGNVYYAAVYSGIGANTAPAQGTLVAEFNPALPIEPRYRDSTGKIWTLNGSAYSFVGVA